MKEPRWLQIKNLHLVHDDQIRQWGGLQGTRDENLLESALNRPKFKWQYEPKSDIFDLAADYCVGIAKNHPFLDGDKRSAFLAMAIFLRLNGYDLDAPQHIALLTMIAVASGEIGERELSAWLRLYCKERG